MRPFSLGKARLVDWATKQEHASWCHLFPGASAICGWFEQYIVNLRISLHTCKHQHLHRIGWGKGKYLGERILCFYPWQLNASLYPWLIFWKKCTTKFVTLWRIFKKKNFQANPSIHWLESSKIARTCHHRRADSEPFTYRQPRVISLLDLHVRDLWGNTNHKEKNKREWNLFCCHHQCHCAMFSFFLFLKWKNVIKIKLHKWLIQVV